MKKKIDQLLKTAMERCFERGTLIRGPVPEYAIEVPNHRIHGHLATNLPLVLAPSQRRPPLEIASLIVENLEDKDEILEEALPAKPGFINFVVKSRAWYRLLEDILNLGHHYGRSEMGKGERVLVEFVSANPTGPLHLGHGRGAALGDTLSRILSFCGYDVSREFYVNDAGQQINLLGASIFSRWKQMSEPEYPFPKDGYHGDYVVELAKEIGEHEDLGGMSEGDAISYCAEQGKRRMLEEIRQDLTRFGVKFDLWYSESELFGSGMLERALNEIEQRGELYEADGALWITTSHFGDDKDRVVRKKDGQFTYFASDIAYHLNKKNRGFSKAINLWGADHHGYVPRMKAALRAQGFPEDWLSVLLIQLVKLWRGGQEVKMSKRAGQYVTLKELMEEVGVDAVRFVFLTKSHDSALDFDVDLVKRKDSDNPVYYVQYAHARICSIFRKASELGLSPLQGDLEALECLVLEEEISLIRQMAEFPSLLEEISRSLEPHRLTYYLTQLAAAFHRYFNLGTKHPEHRIATPVVELGRARLALAQAVKTVLENGLILLGTSAPERM